MTVTISGSLNLKEAYAYCRELAQSHYENFPVASLFIPKSKRKYFYAAYAFMRTADDFADSSVIDLNLRLQLLSQWQNKLDKCYKGQTEDPIFIALKDTVETCGIPKEYFNNLLNAFKVDLFKSRYQNFDELLEYCSFSANPVGRIVLHILGYVNHPDKENLFSASDSICTALQLANHWQDVFDDQKRGRMYLPQDDLLRFGYTAEDWQNNLVNSAFKELMKFQIDRASGLFHKGRVLLGQLKRPERFEITLIWLGGMRILEKIEKNKFDVLSRRPTLGYSDFARILFRLITFKH
jgi:squalene synthase HpnC